MNRIYRMLTKILPVALFLMLVTACGSEEKALVTKAETEGAEAAHALIADMPLSEIEMQNRLLTVLNNEYELRKDGHTEAANAYMESFINVLTSESDSLSNIMGYEKKFN